jgi:hypothetical protein
VVSSEYDLYSFYPPTATFTRIGHISCPAPASSQPFSMAVDRRGVAYVVFDSRSPGGAGRGALYRVSTATAACIATPFPPNQHGFATFGMGFASNTNGPDETLFVASDNAPPSLGTIDTKSFVLSVVAPFNPPIVRAELTGTGDGRLFAFYQRSPGSAIAQVDKATARVIAESPLPNIEQINHWAFAFWGGDFYTFTGPDGSTEVNRFRPADNSVTRVTTLGASIVGAGVSTCAPEK